MKKRLLITLGCSLTEGVGCYDYSINPGKLHFGKLNAKDKKRTLDNFHKEGWPNRVGKALNFDKVINLGSGGSSNCTHLKLFTDKIKTKISKLNEEYDIFLIWMMTEPTRFSFYTVDTILQFCPVEAIDPYVDIVPNPIEESYLKYIKEYRIGPMREQIFLIELAESLFRENKIKPLFTSWSNMLPDLFRMYKSEYWLSPKPSYLLKEVIKDRKNISDAAHCGHPNENGYEIIANQLVEDIKKHHPEFYSNTPVEKFDWEWDGSVIYTSPKKGTSFNLF